MKVTLRVALACRFRDQYRITANTIEKRGKLYCQLYGAEPIPQDKKYFFEMRVMRLAYQNITVGLITEDNFEYTYSRDKNGCICFDAYTHSIYVEGDKV